MKKQVKSGVLPRRAPAYRVFWATKYAVGSLSSKELLTFFGHVSIRSALSVLDLLGLILITLSISMLSTGPTALSNSGYVGQALEAIGLTTMHNSYALVLLIAVGFFALKSVVSIQSTRSLSKFIAGHEARKSTEIFSNSLACDISTLDSVSEKDMGFSLLTSTEYAFGKSLMAIAVIAGEAVSILMISLFLLASDSTVFVFVFMFFGLVAAAMNMAVSKSSRLAGNEIDQHSRAALAIIQDSIKLSRELRLSRAQGPFIAKFRDARGRLAFAYARVNIVSVLPRYVIELAMMVALAIFGLGKAGDLISMSPAVLGLFVAGCFRIASSLIPLQGYLGALRQIDEIGQGARDLELKTVTPKENLFTGSVKPDSSSFVLEAQNLGYAYDGNEILFKGINVVLAGQSFSALVGASGVGKTTFAEVLAGLRKPTFGQIVISGAGGSASDPSSARIALVPQHPQLLAGTLLENITLSDDCGSPDFGLLQDILEKVELKKFVDDLPLGLNTMVGEGFRALSGGQKQRLGIARALYQQPIFLILDEPTSALDEDIERAVTSVLEKLKGKVTLLVIAHRVDTIRAADRVLKLERGGLIEMPRDHSKRSTING